MNAETCSKYDKHFITKQDELVNYVAWYPAGVQDAKDSELTFTDWNLQNSSGIPVASGVCLIHVDVPGIGEKGLKLFAGMHEADYYGY